MTTMLEWLAAQLDADEQAAKAATPGPWSAEGIWDADGVQDWTIGLPDQDDDTGRPILAEIFHMDGRADATHIARHDPARVLATVTALRAIVGLHGGHEVKVYTEPQTVPMEWNRKPTGPFEIHQHCDECDLDTEWPCPTLLAVASVFAGRPGWQEWE